MQITEVMTLDVVVSPDTTAAAVRDAMTTAVVSCFEDQEAPEAVGLMKAHKIRRLPVLH